MESDELIDLLNTWFYYAVDLDNPNLPGYERFSFLFEAIHSHNKRASCYKVHNSWREESEKVLTELNDKCRRRK